MMRLDPDRVRWIFIHTAAYSGDCGAAEIDDWHRRRGWDAIGYHYVVRRDGRIEPGRELDFAGAHVQGCNTKSVGICCEGHGDYEDHPPAQREALLDLCRTLMETYDVAPADVLGHREVNRLIDEDLVGDQYRTHKTCPGERVDMDEIRAALAAPGMPDVPDELPEPVVEIADTLGVTRWERMDELDAEL